LCAIVLLKRQCDTQFAPQVHRRCLHDDGFGVEEALNEIAFGKGLVARGRHYVMFGAINGISPNMAAQERLLANRKYLSAWLFFSPGGTSFEDWRANYKMEVHVQYTEHFFNTRHQFRRVSYIKIMKEFLVNLYPKKSRFRAVQSQMIKDIEDATISRVSAHEGGKNGSPTV